MKKKNKKNNKKDNSFKTIYEYLFVGFSIFCIILIISIYAYRTIYYYNKENNNKIDSKLVDIIFNPLNVIYTGDGLYKDNNNYYFYGTNVNNYLYFSGRLWRVVGLDDNGIKIITADNQTSLIWGNNVNYNESKIYEWLNKDVFINTINEKDIIVKSNWCNTSIDINNYKCNDTTESMVGLITTNEYIKSGGVNSYLNIKSYFWTLNTSPDKKAYYVHNNGGLNNDTGHNNTLYSYGVRPVIYLNKDIVYNSGDGTLDNPYIINTNKDINIGSHYIGEYVLYNGYKFRIIEQTDNYTKLILDGYILNDNNEPVKISYNNINSYLDNNFINEFNIDELVKIKYSIIEYNTNNDYNYNDSVNEIESFVSIPNISDMFISSYTDNWLNTYNNKEKELVYKTNDFGSVIADLENEENYLRVVIAIRNDLLISGGNGTKNDPYRIGDNK